MTSDVTAPGGGVLRGRAPVRVLVADDDPDLRFLLEEWLKAGAYDVVGVAEDGLEAVRAAEALRPELVVLDLAMPRMDGLEAATRLRRVLPHARIVIHSAFSAQRMAQKAIDAGADVYVEKSAGPRPLLAALDELFSSPALHSTPPFPAPRRRHPEAPRPTREELLLDALDVGVVFTDARGRVVSANFAASLILDVPTSRIVGWRVADQLARAERASGHGPESAQGDPLTTALASGRPQSGSVLGLARGDGRLTWVSVNVRPFAAAGEDPSSGAVVTLQDVTELRRTSARLPEAGDEATELLEAAVASSPVGTALFDPSGRLVIANPVADRLLGGSVVLEQEPVTRKVLRADTGEPVAVDDLPVNRACRGEHFEGLEVLVVDIRDSVDAAYLQMSGGPVRGADGRPAGAVVSVLDITAAKRAEQALAATHADLERSNAELEEFAYVASHDLSQPLQTVYGFAQLLREAGPDDPRAQEYVDRIVTGCQRMRTLIADLLTCSRVTTEARRIETVDLASVVDEVVAVLLPRGEESGARVDVCDLPTVRADATQMGQLLQNLVGNALTYVRPGATPRVRVESFRDGDAWQVVVSDNGIGIPPADRERAFRMFQRLTPPSTYPGTGIGLAVCARIVERHGGRIWVEDNPGGGSRFCFTLPDEPRAAPA